MKLDPSLFDARTLFNDTRLLWKLKLLLGTVCAYGGEVPLTVSELAKRMKTDNYRIRVLLQKLTYEGVVHYDEAGTLFFDRYKFISSNEIGKEELYAKNFVFFTCDEFLSEERNVQRFVLHYVGKELVYIPGNFKWNQIKSLYGEEGLLNIRTRKEALAVLEKASKYLSIKITKENFQVLHLRKEWMDMGEIHSEGAELWVMKQLQKHRFCCDFISRKAVWQIAKVMEYYYAEFGYDYATDIFDTALYNIQKGKISSQKFLAMIYRPDDSYVVNDEVNELDEISAYFRAVMEAAELNYAVQLSMDLDVHSKTVEQVGKQFKNDDLAEVYEAAIKEAQVKKETTWKKLLIMQRHWMKKFDSNPEWFLKNRYRISTLPAPIYEINAKIEKYLFQKERDHRQMAWAN